MNKMESESTGFWSPAGRFAHIYKLQENGKYGDPLITEKEGLLKSSVLEGLNLDLREILPDRFF